jgi:hypothetical protein
MQTIEKEQFTLAQLAAELKHETGHDRFYGRLFSIVTPNHAEAIKFIMSLSLLKETLPNRSPVRIVIGDFSKVVQHESKLVPFVKEGAIIIHAVLSHSNLPECDYLAIIAPVHSANDSKNYAPAYAAIDFVRSFLTLTFGSLISYRLVSEFEFDLEGRVSQGSETFRRPMMADFIQVLDKDLLLKIANRLSLQQEEFRKRLQNACTFLSNALSNSNESVRFAFYWIALEVLVGGRGEAIKSVLSKAYQITLQDVAMALCFDEIANKRHDLIHRGMFTKLLAYQERLLQLYFWDIVIFKIGLPCARLAEAVALSDRVGEERKMEQP